MYVCMYVCVCVYIYIYVYIIYLSTYLSFYLSIFYLSIYLSIYIRHTYCRCSTFPRQGCPWTPFTSRATTVTWASMATRLSVIDLNTALIAP